MGLPANSKTQGQRCTHLVALVPVTRLSNAPALALLSSRKDIRMRPLVYGYIRVFPRDPRRQPDCFRGGIESYACSEGLDLAEVFVEQTAAEGYGERPAFTALMEALRPGEAYGVIVPGLRHLSRFSGVQFFVCSLIQRETGARVISLDSPHPPPGLVVEPK
jgi:hypothetical protein